MKLSTEQKALSIIALALMAGVIILSCILFVQLQEVRRIQEELTEKAPTELETKLMKYLDGQIEYYEYNLNGLKAWDEVQK